MKFLAYYNFKWENYPLIARLAHVILCYIAKLPNIFEEKKKVTFYNVLYVSAAQKIRSIYIFKIFRSNLQREQNTFLKYNFQTYIRVSSSRKIYKSPQLIVQYFVLIFLLTRCKKRKCNSKESSYAPLEKRKKP